MDKKRPENLEYSASQEHANEAKAEVASIDHNIVEVCAYLEELKQYR